MLLLARGVSVLLRQRRCSNLKCITTATNEENNKEWRERLQQWATTLSVASDSSSSSPSKQDQASALCDIGFAYHQGTVPASDTPNTTLPADISKAKVMYEQSAALNYAPAASLLADFYFYTHSADQEEQATRWCHTTLQLTDPTLPEDAYIRSRSNQKLGILSYRKDQHHTQQSQSHFEDSLDSCQRHLGGNWPFLLSHDPPDLFPLLQKESQDLDNIPQLQKNLSGFQTSPNWEIGSPESVVTLRNYTLKLRDIETKDKAFALSFQRESLDLFPSSSEGNAWGITYLSSFFQVLGNPLIQQNMSKKKKFKMVVLGSALGNACVWPAAAFGCSAVGFDVMETCVHTSNKLIESVAGAGGDRLRENVRFRNIDVLKEIEEIQAAIDCCGDEMSVVWSNDFSWGEHAQIQVENKAFEAMRSGDVIVLYRPPRTLGVNEWSHGGKISNIAVSWNVRSTMYVLVK